MHINKKISFAIIQLLLNIRCIRSKSSNTFELNEDGTEVAKTITNMGYPLELHNVNTEDGYILTTFRIPHGIRKVNDSELSKNQNETGKKPVAFFMHGLFGSAYDYVCTGPTKSLALMFSEKGYDVWLGNARGNIISRNHKYLNPQRDENFWDYSWNEIGYYDIPANIDYILNVTGETELVYIGISMGTTTFFVMCSERPQYNKRIKLMVAFAPVAYMTHAQGYVKTLSRNVNFFKRYVVPMFGLTEMLPTHMNNGLKMIFKMYCNNGNVFQEVCIAIAFSSIGVKVLNGYHFNKTMAPDLMKFGATGASVKQLYHYAQLIATDKFAKYDYGKGLNLIKYKSEIAPSYNLSKVTAPVALFYGDEDVYVPQADLNRLKSELRNVVIDYKIPYKNFNHFDYIIANGVEDILYTEIFKLLET